MVGDDYESDNTRDGGGTSSTLRPSWSMGRTETGSEGTYHTHVYFVLRTPTVHTVVENRFPNIHRENVKGTSQQNRDYVLKEGPQSGHHGELNVYVQFYLCSSCRWAQHQ